MFATLFTSRFPHIGQSCRVALSKGSGAIEIERSATISDWLLGGSVSATGEDPYGLSEYLNRLRTVISVVDLQSDLERERARSAAQGRRGQNRVTRDRLASCPLDGGCWVCPSVLCGIGGCCVAPVFATCHRSLGIASRARQSQRHRS